MSKAEERFNWKNRFRHIQVEDLNVGPDTTENIDERHEGKTPGDLQSLHHGPEDYEDSLQSVDHEAIESMERKNCRPEFPFRETDGKETDKPGYLSIPKSFAERYKKLSGCKDRETPEPLEFEDDPMADFGKILERMFDTHKRKNHDYGDAAHLGYKEMGMSYYLGIIFNKYHRLKTLTKTGTTVLVDDESIDDTLLDLANYAVMALQSRHRND